MNEEQWEKQHKEWLRRVLISPSESEEHKKVSEKIDDNMVGSFYPAVTAANSEQCVAPPRFQCTQCNMTLASKSALTAHSRSHRTNASPPEPHKCDVCDKTFAVPARLARHYRTHTGERPFKCEFCPKMFSVKENLQVHRRIHTKERPYRCTVCNSAFEHSGKLHRHMRIHTGERPHACLICGKTFIQSGQLVIHLRTHTGEKPYRCTAPGCGKGFTCSKQLKVHSRTHTGEKPYHCDICFRDFGYNHVLKLHRFQHYGAKCYKCTICEDTFKSKKEMELHIRRHADAPGPVLINEEKHCDEHQNNMIQDLSSGRITVKAEKYETENNITSLKVPTPVIEPYIIDSKLNTRELIEEGAMRNMHESAKNCDLNNLTYTSSSASPTYPSPVRFLSAYGPQGDIVRCVEAALAVASPPTPPPSTPERSSSPEDQPPACSLPLRKRKLYMTGETNSIPVRVDSVIQFAPAS